MNWKPISIETFVSHYINSFLKDEEREYGSVVYHLANGTQLRVCSEWSMDDDHVISLKSPTFYWWGSTDKEYVLEIYPNALIHQSLNRRIHILSDTGYLNTTLGVGDTEDEAWKNAADTLRKNHEEA